MRIRLSRIFSTCQELLGTALVYRNNDARLKQWEVTELKKLDHYIAILKASRIIKIGDFGYFVFNQESPLHGMSQKLLLSMAAKQDIPLSVFAKYIDYPFFYVDTIENNIIVSTNNKQFLAYQGKDEIKILESKIEDKGAIRLPFNSVLGLSIDNINLSSLTTIKVK